MIRRPQAHPLHPVLKREVYRTTVIEALLCGVQNLAPTNMTKVGNDDIRLGFTRTIVG